MKKRLLSALLALALVFVLLPTTALAETPAIKIAGTVIEDGKYYYTNGGIGELKTEAQQKTWNVRRDGNTLYLKNAKINTTDTQSIQVWMMSVTINLEGDSTITTKGEGSIVSQFAGSLTIKGNGKLTIESNTAGSSIVWNSGDVTITGDAVVNITNKNSGQLSEAIGLTNSYELTVSGNAKLKAVSNGSKAATVNSKKLTIADNAEFNVINQNSSGKAVSFKSIEVAAGYDCNGINGNGITDWTKTTAEELNTFQKVWVKPTPTPTLEKSNVYVASTNLYKNTAYTIQNGKPVMGGTYPGNYNIYLDATGSNYVLHVKGANIDARGTTGIYGTSNIVFEGDNSITASTYGIYSYFTQSDLKISGTGSLNVKTIAGDPAIATAYDTSRSIIISGNNFTVTADTSETTSYAIKSDNDLKITDGAAVIAKSNATRAIDIKGDLTVTNGSLTATSKSNNVPTVQVGGNASFTGSTVTITNNSTTQGEQYKDSNAASSALHVNGAVTISGGTVTAEAKAGGNAIRAVGNITVSNDATVTAKNNSQYFNAITAGSATGGEVNTLYNLIVSGENTRITATNTHNNNLAYGGAINAYIKNANEGHYLKVGTDTKAIAPNAKTTVKNNSLTITRGDAYTTPQVAANYTIAGQTMYVGKYYKTDVNGNITDGTAQDYNIYCDSENDFTLNNATISSTGTSGSTGVIKTNLNYSSAQFHIKLIGTNSINNAGHHAILGEGAYSTIIIENAENASNASLTISGNFLPVYSFGNVTINAEVVIINTNGNLISTNKGGHANGAFDLGSGYKCYASTDVSGSPLEAYDAAKGSTYKYLRVTKENLAPTTPTPQTPFTIYGIPAQFVDGGMIATTGVTATSSNNINLPIDRVEWYTFTPGFRPDGSMDSVINKTKATGNFEAGKYYVVEIRFVQDLSPFESWDMKVSGWSDNDVSRQSVTARNDIEIYFLTPASAATHEHNWAENYDTVYHWKMCTYDGCTAIKDKALHVWNAWHTSNNEQQHWKSCSECSYSTPPHDIDLAYVSDGEQGHHLYCKHDGCTFVTGTTAHVYAEGSNICTDCGYNKSAPCDHTGDRAYTNNGDGTHKVTCKACGATIVEKQNHEFGPTGACIYCGATQSGGDPTPDNPGTIVIIRPAEEEKPAQQPNPSTGANDLVGLAVAAAVAAALGSAALLRKHD